MSWTSYNNVEATCRHDVYTLFIREIKWNAINLKSGNRSASRDDNFYKAFFQAFKTFRESNKALHSEQKDGERISRLVLNRCMFSEVMCNRFTEDAC